MDRIELEAKLEAGQEWGFRKETNHPNYLGWILISKRNPLLFIQRRATDLNIFIECIFVISRNRAEYCTT